MPESTIITEGIQLGVETTYGTSVAANKKLQSMSIDIGPMWEGQRIRPQGYIWPTLYPPMREWSEGSVDGTGVFDEIIYPLNSILSVGVITTPTGATAARRHTFTPSSTSVNAVKSYTIEIGDAATRAFKSTGAQFTGFSLNVDKEGGVTVGGSIIARAIIDGITLTATPTLLPLIPMLATQTSVYLDDTWAGLGTTKATRLFAAGFEIGNMVSPVWVLDAAQPSFVALAQSEPSGSVTIVQEYDAAGAGLLTQMRAGSTKFVQISIVGGLIEGAITYDALFKLAVKVSGPPTRGDRNGVRTWEWPADIVHDATGGYAINAVITNSTIAL